MTTQYCKTCESHEDLTGLVGIHSNCCPKCGNPIMPITFGALKNGTVFVPDECPAMWVKLSNTMAVCVDREDSVYQVGETQGFIENEVVYPY